MDEHATDIEAEAVAAMQVTIRRLAHNYPFHAALISRWQVGIDEEISTAAVTIRRNDVHLLLNPAFVVQCTLPQLEAVLHHEINHVVFGHLFLDPTNYPDDDAFIIATEVTANEFVREPLPGEPVLLAQYPFLAPHEDTDSRYQHLIAKRAAQKMGMEGRKLGPVVKDSVPPGPNSVQLEPKNVPGGPKNVPGGPNSEAVEPLDDHEAWSEARTSGDLGRLVVREIVRAACDTLTQAQVEALPAPLRTAITKAIQGHQAGGEVTELRERPDAPTLDWRALLRRCVGRALVIVPTFSRPPRRFPALVGVVPGRAHRASRPVVMAVIDTSGSIDQATLDAIAAELTALRRQYDVTVVECDATVQAIYELTGPLQHVHGRGGTNLCPPFEQAVLRQVRPDVIIYFTDGEGSAPIRRPRAPVIWCLTPKGRKPASWGRVVRMDACARIQPRHSRRK